MVIDVKYTDFQDWCRVSELMPKNRGVHKTQEGFELIS